MLELIQNADDNKYGVDVVPRLTFVYRTDGFLWIGCNELGFSPANVRAICGIGGSTKKVEGSQKGYIGEKGIGFKSVFKVAEKVWIKSGALEFRFDKTKSLGMIAPEWCDFKRNPLIDERTMFCFEVPVLEHRQVVQKNLQELTPELLLFLRQLRCIDVKIQEPDGKLQDCFCLDRDDGLDDGLRLTTLSRDAAQSCGKQKDRYLVCQRTADSMPLEEKRPNVTETEVLIAFPITEQGEPKQQNCTTFNFLPIRDYGLPVN